MESVVVVKESKMILTLELKLEVVDEKQMNLAKMILTKRILETFVEDMEESLKAYGYGKIHSQIIVD